MTNFVDSLNEVSRKRWDGMEECVEKKEVIGIYEQLTGKKWVPPKKDKQTIKCEPKMENLSEISKLMREKPNPTERK